ncbi:MAG TPA: cation:proton antiporter [Gemmatimonadales bacterium]|nr:cation:proton antiporter [Gemmatimonadales bacterium]
MNPGFVLAAVALFLSAAWIGGHLAARVGQPRVLGELVAGVLLGNLGHLGLHVLEAAPGNPVLEALAQLGVLLLLFQVGLETTFRDLRKVGGVATMVAVTGVVAPFLLGWGVGAWLLPGHSSYTYAFLGATLTATSVGITARVLSDLGAAQSPEARVILGAAAIDDVLGLVLLAIVAGAIDAAARGQALAAGPVLIIAIKALVFLVGAVALGPLVSRALFRAAARLPGPGALVVTGLVICFGFSWLAGMAGLASIVGAYAAGLLLEADHWREFSARGEKTLGELVRPAGFLLTPLFFILMGMRVDFAVFLQPGVLGLAVALTAAAIVGKQACALVVRGQGLDARSIGVGMIPRGEVGLIFAGVGLTLTLARERILDGATYSAIAIVVIVTTLATPPALKWSLARGLRIRDR